MKASVKNKRFVDKKNKLINMLPLDTPLSLLIESSDKCNFKCNFCPTSDLNLMKNTSGRNYGNIDFELYKKVIDDIKLFNNKIKTLHLHKSGEPLLNKKIADMIKYAKDSNCIETISITTNGYLLNNELSLQIIDAGIDRINISIEGINAKQYLEIANVNINFDDFVNKIAFLFKNKKNCIISIKIVDANLNENDKKEFFRIFGDICDYISIENIIPWNEFDIDTSLISQNKSIYKGNLHHNILICPKIFYQIAVNSDGSVSACCDDWGHKVIVGNINEKSLVDIWNSEELKELRLLFIRGNRNKHPFCKDCSSIVYDTINENVIDDYSETLFAMYNRTEQNRTEQNRTEQNRTEQNRTEQF
ncbi:radical SAM/SPASM domain-containing protein [Brachyspira pilosicoli]|uniref:Radical SAM protein n=1 Tax=Brachyspira pilosicoli TaxID=52584 RepID=A0A5C8EBU7_BRAPL|nr:radical SAM/SPASM domain-containing protein [Brachyspira pilosicoli]TXJ35256.1 radical SAM protein [Brachyspira pilosicoli]